MPMHQKMEEDNEIEGMMVEALDTEWKNNQNGESDSKRRRGEPTHFVRTFVKKF